MVETRFTPGPRRSMISGFGSRKPNRLRKKWLAMTTIPLMASRRYRRSPKLRSACGPGLRRSSTGCSGLRPPPVAGKAVSSIGSGACVIEGSSVRGTGCGNGRRAVRDGGRPVRSGGDARNVARRLRLRRGAQGDEGENGDPLHHSEEGETFPAAPEEHASGDDHVRERDGEHHLPAEPHDLVVPEPGEGPAGEELHPDE